MKKVVHLCVILDDDYSIPTAVMLTSAKANKHVDSRYIVHIVETNVISYNLNKLKSLNDADFEIVIHHADIAKYKKVVMKSHVTMSALVKFDLATILADVDKAIYLDGDIIVRKDLSEFYSIPLEDYILAGVRDIGGEIGFNLHNVVGCGKYINSGVMLLNLDKMRSQNTPETFLKNKLQEPAEWKMADQNTINQVCHKETMYLPVKYNLLVTFCRDRYSVQDVNKFYGTDYSCRAEMLEDAIILHLAGDALQRPWKYWNGQYSLTWNKYYDMSPYSELDLHLLPNQRALNEIKVYVSRSIKKLWLMTIKSRLSCDRYRYIILSKLLFGKKKKYYLEKLTQIDTSIRYMKEYENFINLMKLSNY